MYQPRELRGDYRTEQVWGGGMPIAQARMRQSTNFMKAPVGLASLVEKEAKQLNENGKLWRWENPGQRGALNLSLTEYAAHIVTRYHETERTRIVEGPEGHQHQAYPVGINPLLVDTSSDHNHILLGHIDGKSDHAGKLALAGSTFLRREFDRIGTALYTAFLRGIRSKTNISPDVMTSDAWNAYLLGAVMSEETTDVGVVALWRADYLGVVEANPQGNYDRVIRVPESAISDIIETGRFEGVHVVDQARGSLQLFAEHESKRR